MTTPTHTLLGQTEGAQELVRAVQAAAPYAAGKLGTSEFEALCWYVDHRRHQTHPTQYPVHIFRHMVVNAGLFPSRPETVDHWAEHMLQHVLPAMDVMVEWNPVSKLHEHYFLETHAPHSKRTVLRALEPYYEPDPSNRYTLAIPEGAKIAIVSPFADTIMKQSTKIDASGAWYLRLTPKFLMRPAEISKAVSITVAKDSGRMGSD